MKEIEKPSLVIDEISPDGRYGKFVWEPLERGYGITLGNSLRRVLLSSLSGMAVTGIKIDGVLHEFSTIEGVREDVADIVLNIKALCFKVNLDDQGTYEPKTFYIKKSGEGEVTGADIITDQDTEVLNPELIRTNPRISPLDSFLSTPSILRSRASSLVSPILVSATSPTMTA